MEEGIHCVLQKKVQALDSVEEKPLLMISIDWRKVTLMMAHPFFGHQLVIWIWSWFPILPASLLLAWGKDFWCHKDAVCWGSFMLELGGCKLFFYHCFTCHFIDFCALKIHLSEPFLGMDYQMDDRCLGDLLVWGSAVIFSQVLKLDHFVGLFILLFWTFFRFRGCTQFIIYYCAWEGVLE